MCVYVLSLTLAFIRNRIRIVDSTLSVYIIRNAIVFEQVLS